MIIRIVEYENWDTNKESIYDIVEFMPIHIKSGKFNKYTQRIFDKMLRAMDNGKHITLDKTFR